MPARAPRTTSSGDTRSAKTQLATADQAARVAKDKRVKADPSSKDGLRNTLKTKVMVRDTDEDGVETGTETETEVSEDFLLAEDVGIMPLMEWAAASDVDVNSAAGLRAVYYVLQDVVAKGEWAKFRKFSRENKVGAEELLDFANSSMEVLAGRPTGESAGS
jgi:hypothetical protein